MTAPRNQWYAAAWDGDVSTGLLARTICGEDLILYRKMDGSVVAMHDVCPHRLLPLSLGIREGDSVRCKYHGLKVGPDGVTEEMPLKEEKPNKNMCARLYPVVEKHRFVWVWIGDAERADEALVPDLWPCSDPAWTFDGGYYHIKCDYRLLIDNLMDLTHETYVHADTIGQQELMEVPVEGRVEDDGVVVARWMENICPPPFWASAIKSTGNVDRWQICKFLPVSCVMIDVGVAPVGAGATMERHDQGVGGMVINAITPSKDGECHYFWGMARNFDTDDRGLTHRIKMQQHKIFGEDLEILERQQDAIVANPDLKLRTLGIDFGGAHARRMIDALMTQTEDA